MHLSRDDTVEHRRRRVKPNPYSCNPLLLGSFYPTSSCSPHRVSAPLLIKPGQRLCLMATSSQALQAPSKKTSLANVKADAGRMSFDVGINASSAWTGAREGVPAGVLEEKASVEAAITEESESDQESDPPRPARALYDFEGKDDLREL